MQNDMLKNNIVPWQEKGRWYHISLTSDGSAWTINKPKSDEFFNSSSVVASYYISLNGYGKSVIDVKTRYYNKPNSSINITTSVSISIQTAEQYLVLPIPTYYTGDFDCWLFMVEN